MRHSIQKDLKLNPGLFFKFFEMASKHFRFYLNQPELLKHQLQKAP